MKLPIAEGGRIVGRILKADIEHDYELMLYRFKLRIRFSDARWNHLVGALGEAELDDKFCQREDGSVVLEAEVIDEEHLQYLLEGGDDATAERAEAGSAPDAIRA